MRAHMNKELELENAKRMLENAGYVVVKKIKSRSFDNKENCYSALPHGETLKKVKDKIFAMTPKEANETGIITKAGSLAEEYGGESPNYERCLIHRFLTLPFRYQMAIANKFDIFKNEDSGAKPSPGSWRKTALNDEALFRSLFKYASEKGLLGKLWAETENFHDDPVDFNPFETFDGEEESIQTGLTKVHMKYIHIDNGGITISLKDDVDGLWFSIETQYFGYPGLNATMSIDQVASDFLEALKDFAESAKVDVDNIDWCERFKFNGNN